MKYYFDEEKINIGRRKRRRIKSIKKKIRIIKSKKRRKTKTKIFYYMKYILLLNCLIIFSFLLFYILKNKFFLKNINSLVSKKGNLDIELKVNNNNQTIRTIYNKSDMIIKKTYSQFYEDLILNIFFYDIQNGFYIDVGANDPDRISVTKFFYLKGWSGINIDPLQSSYDRLMSERPRDINVKICVGNHTGNITIYESGDHTTTHKKYSKPYFKKNNMKLDTMSNICRSYIPKNKEIHFCKIDVEGDEREVLLGFDFKNYRPKIFCIESTVPGVENIYTYNKYEYILTENNYEFIYQYKINRFYIDKYLFYLKERAKYIDEAIIIFEKSQNISLI